MNEFELARKVKSNEPDDIYNEIFEMVKSDPKLLNEIVHTHVSLLTERVADIKYTVNMFNGIEEKEEVEEVKTEK